jgi:hypothetical protein
LEDLDLAKARKTYASEIEEGKKMVQDLRTTEAPMQSESDATIDKIKKLAEMKDAGILSEEEFKQLKERLLGQI